MYFIVALFHYSTFLRPAEEKAIAIVLNVFWPCCTMWNAHRVASILLGKWMNMLFRGALKVVTEKMTYLQKDLKRKRHCSSIFTLVSCWMEWDLYLAYLSFK